MGGFDNWLLSQAPPCLASVNLNNVIPKCNRQGVRKEPLAPPPALPPPSPPKPSCGISTRALEAENEKKGELSITPSAGVFYWLGTERGTSDWKNPFDTKKVSIVVSSARCGELSQIVDRQFSQQRFFTAPHPRQWVITDLSPSNVEVCATRYRIAHRGGNILKWFLRNWVVEGAHSKAGPWEKLSVHSNDRTISSGSLIGRYEMNVGNKEFFSVFRVTMIGKNSEGTDAFVFNCFELWGEVREARKDAPIVPSKPLTSTNETPKNSPSNSPGDEKAAQVLARRSPTATSPSPTLAPPTTLPTTPPAAPDAKTAIATTPIILSDDDTDDGWGSE